MNETKGKTAEERLLNALFGAEVFDGHYYCIFCKPIDENDAGSWFSEWIRYRDDLPDGMKEWLDQAGAKPGESVPMFTGGGAEQRDGMAFRYKAMAEYTKAKIEKLYPDLTGKLHVMICEDAPEEGDGE